MNEEEKKRLELELELLSLEKEKLALSKEQDTKDDVPLFKKITEQLPVAGSIAAPLGVGLSSGGIGFLGAAGAAGAGAMGGKAIQQIADELYDVANDIPSEKKTTIGLLGEQLKEGGTAALLDAATAGLFHGGGKLAKKALEKSIPLLSSISGVAPDAIEYAIKKPKEFVAKTVVGAKELGESLLDRLGPRGDELSRAFNAVEKRFIKTHGDKPAQNIAKAPLKELLAQPQTLSKSDLKIIEDYINPSRSLDVPLFKQTPSSSEKTLLGEVPSAQIPSEGYVYSSPETGVISKQAQKETIPGYNVYGENVVPGQTSVSGTKTVSVPKEDMTVKDLYTAYRDMGNLVNYSKGETAKRVENTALEGTLKGIRKKAKGIFAGIDPKFGQFVESFGKQKRGLEAVSRRLDKDVPETFVEKLVSMKSPAKRQYLLKSAEDVAPGIGLGLEKEIAKEGFKSSDRNAAINAIRLALGGSGLVGSTYYGSPVGLATSAAMLAGHPSSLKYLIPRASIALQSKVLPKVATRAISPFLYMGVKE